jgi:tetratricopeptide (TPR) repeat protein
MNPFLFLIGGALLFGCGPFLSLNPAAEVVAEYARAKEHYLRGRTSDALRILKTSQGLRRFAPAAFLRGKILFLTGEVSDAERTWTGLLEDRPCHGEARKWLARLFLNDGRSGEAERLAAEALADDPEDPELLILTGKARLLQGDTAGAVEYFSKAKTCFERLAEAPLELADIYRSFGLRARAEAELDLALLMLGPESSLYRSVLNLRRTLSEEAP